MIRLVFRCDGAYGRERIGECVEGIVVRLDEYGPAVLPAIVVQIKRKGWTFRPVGLMRTVLRLVVRCPKCEALRVSRNAAKAKSDRLRKARTG